MRKIEHISRAVLSRGAGPAPHTDSYKRGITSAPSQGGGVRPSTGAALLTWDGHASTLLIQWDGDDGLPRYLEWDT